MAPVRRSYAVTVLKKSRTHPNGVANNAMATYVFLWETKKAIATYGFETTSTVTDTVVTITGDVSDVMKVHYVESITDEPVQFTDELRALAFPDPSFFEVGEGNKHGPTPLLAKLVKVGETKKVTSKKGLTFKKTAFELCTLDATEAHVRKITVTVWGEVDKDKDKALPGTMMQLLCVEPVFNKFEAGFVLSRWGKLLFGVKHAQSTYLATKIAELEAKSVALPAGVTALQKLS